MGLFPLPASGLFTRSSSELGLLLWGWASRRHLSWKQEAVNLARENEGRRLGPCPSKARFKRPRGQTRGLSCPSSPELGDQGVGVCPGQRSEPGLRGRRASPGWSPCWASVSPSVRAGGTGSPGPKQDEAWGLTGSAAHAPGVGACLSVCGFAGCCHVRPQSGASRGAGAGVVGSQPTGAEPGSRRGRESGAARGPEPGSSLGSSLARACPAGLPLPEEGAVCRRGSRGLGTSPQGEGLGLPSAGTRRRGSPGLTSCPHDPRILRPLWPGGPHPGLGLKSHWTSVPAPVDWLAAAALL